MVHRSMQAIRYDRLLPIGTKELLHSLQNDNELNFSKEHNNSHIFKYTLRKCDYSPLVAENVIILVWFQRHGLKYSATGVTLTNFNFDCLIHTKISNTRLK